MKKKQYCTRTQFDNSIEHFLNSENKELKHEIFLYLDIALLFLPEITERRKRILILSLYTHYVNNNFTCVSQLGNAFKHYYHETK